MKQSLLQFTRTGMLGLAISAFAALPGAAESVKVVNAAEEETADKAKTAESTVPVTNAAPEVKQQLAPVIPNLSPGLAEIIRLAQAKVGEDVLLAYIARSTTAYNPTTEEIIYLHDLGVSDKVVAEIVKRSPNPEAMLAATKPATTEPLNIPEVKAPTAPTAPTAPALTPLVSTNPGPVMVEPAPVVVQQQPIIAQQPIVIQQAPEDVQYFYGSLAPYGSWVDVDGYGWCWQPTIAVTYTDWRPYHQGGRWLHTDSGWYWQSDYSWGWAPFHYGRWFNHPRRGWCWTPDRVWGPAWVSWRNSSSYCGWAPLPPAAHYRHGFGLSYYDRHVGVSFEFGLGALDYTFVSHGHFYSRDPYRHCLPRQQVTRVYNQTTVNNVIVQGNNNTVVINQGGAPVTQISRASRTEVQKVNVMDMPSAHRSGVQPDRLTRNGGELAVYRPAGPGSNNATTRSGQEPSKGAVATTSGRPDRGPSSSVSGRPSAPTTALQRFESPKNTTLPVLSRPQTATTQSATEPSRSLGTPTHPAGTGIDRPLTPQQPVRPPVATSGRGMPYESPSKRPEVTRLPSSPQPVSGPTVTPSAPRPVTAPAVTLSQPKPVSGAPAIPSPGRPVTPATPEQSRLTPQTPVSSSQPQPSAAQRFDTSRPSGTVIPRTGGYNQRPSLQPSFSGNGSTATLPTTGRTPNSGLPRNGDLPRTELPSSSSRPQTYGTPNSGASQSYVAPSYSAPSTPSYTPPAQSSRPSASTPAPRTYEAPRPSYSAPASRPSYTPPASAPAPAPRSVAPQSTTLPRVSTPPPASSSGGSRPSPSQGQGGSNENRRPGNR